MNHQPSYKTLRILTLAVAATLAATHSPAQASWSFAVLDDSRSSYLSDPANNAYPGDPGGAGSPFYNGTTRISPYYQQVVSALAAETTPIDFVLFPGDLAAGKKPNPTDSEFNANLQTWWAETSAITGKDIPIYTVRGNHEASTASYAAGNSTGAGIWKSDSPIPTKNPLTLDTNGAGTANDQTGLSYSFTHKGSLFIGLDQYATTANGNANSDLAFLNSQLSRDAAHRFVFTHQPVWNNASGELAQDATTMADAMNGKASLIFTGHVHDYQRISKDGYSFIEEIVGTGGAPQGSPVLTGDPSLHILGSAGGNSTGIYGPQTGYLLVTVEDNGSILTQMKLLNDYTDASKGVSSFDAATVPEPSTPALMLMGIAAGAWVRKGRKHLA